GSDQARRDRVDRHAVGDDLGGERLGEARHAGLRRGVGGFGGDGVDDADGGGDVDDAAPAALGHPLDEGARDEEGGVEVPRQLRLPVRVGQLGDRLDHGRVGLRGEAGVVDDDVHFAHGVGDRVGQTVHLGLVAEVRDEADRVDLAGALVDALGGGDDRHGGAEEAQAGGDGVADAVGGSGAGDERDL